MSIARAARKTSKTDLYRTPQECIEVLRMLLSEHKNVSILDPCEGDGRICRALKAPTRSVVGFDLYPDYGVPVDFLAHKKRYDIIAGNPPFSLKAKFIDHALGLAGLVVFLFPMSVVSYNIFHSEYLDRPEYVGRALMTPKLFFNESGAWRLGGTDSYAWFFWDSLNKSRGSFEYYFDLRKIRNKLSN